MNKEVTLNKIFLRTFGCQMNEYDSELVRSILEAARYVFVDQETEADIILLNTCAVRENANRKVHGAVHAIRHKLNGKPAFIGVLGCIASHLKEELLRDRNFPIDFIAGPDSYRQLPELIKSVVAGPGACPDTGDDDKKGQPHLVDLSDFETYEDIYPSRQEGVNAWIAVMRGCNNFCSFCVVPYARGRERSRAPGGVVAEARHLSADGYKQVTLLGQNVNSYHFGQTDFCDWLGMVSEVDGIERIRFTSPHPKDTSNTLIEVMAINPKVCKHIHFPLQSGNSRILQIMNRSYTKERYLEIVDHMRAQCPDIAITTDIIIGFPTETDEEFEDTVEVMKKVEFDSAFIFKYSPRKGTLAEKKYLDDVPEEKKTERIVTLNKIQMDHSLKRNEAMIGQTVPILIERIKKEEGVSTAAGRSDGNKLVVVPDQNYQIGDFLTVTVMSASPHLLRAEAIDE